jgi:enamine deaminase RidA (YjgF/YER057c/UK114 family)
MRVALFALAFAAALAAQGPPVVAGDGYLYTAAFGGDPAAPPERQIDAAFAQLERALAEHGAGLDRVVSVHADMTDLAALPALDAAFARRFPGFKPARVAVGVAALPEGRAVELSAIAVLDTTGMRTVAPPGFTETAYSAGVLTHDRLFVSNFAGTTGGHPVEAALDALAATVQAAGLTLAHLVFVQPWLGPTLDAPDWNARYARRFEFGNTPARATIFVSELPDSAPISFSGVAVRDLARRRSVRPRNMAPSPTASPCVFAGDTLFCSAKSGFIPGPNSGIYAPTPAAQARQTMRNQLDNLEQAGLAVSDLVWFKTWLDDQADAEDVERVFAEYFDGTGPARSTVQQVAARPASRRPDERGRYGPLEQAALIAVRRP